MDEVKTVDDIIIRTGEITFNGYDQLKQQALAVAAYISMIEVNDENIKEAKKVLAQANNSIKELESRRIAIKKEMMIPYQEFEKKVKDIVNIVKEAEEIVKEQVKIIEENERKCKEAEIKEIWDIRIEQYPFNFVQFEDFLKPEYLNKTTKMKKIEEDMILFLENIQKDIELIPKLENGKEILVEYQKSLNLNEAINEVNNRKIFTENANIVYDELEVEKQYEFRVFNEKDYKLIKMFMDSNNIKYEITL